MCEHLNNSVIFGFNWKYFVTNNFEVSKFMTLFDEQLQIYKPS